MCEHLSPLSRTGIFDVPEHLTYVADQHASGGGNAGLAHRPSSNTNSRRHRAVAVPRILTMSNSPFPPSPKLRRASTQHISFPRRIRAQVLVFIPTPSKGWRSADRRIVLSCRACERDAPHNAGRSPLGAPP